MITIVIPTYNAQETLARAIDSVIAQTFLQYELLIIDGNSKDETLKIIKQYQEKNDKIKFISEPDKGIYDAMNKGIALAKNEWIYFLGSDDYLYADDILGKIAETINNSNCDVIYGSVFNQSIQGKYDGEFNFEKICRDGICHQAIFYKKNILQNLGCYDITMKAYAHIYLDKLLFANPKIKWQYIDEIVAYYSADGFSKSFFDISYWTKAENLLNENYAKYVSKKVIYESLMPIVKYQFTLYSFIVSIKASFFCVSLKPLATWLKHPLSIPRLFLKNKLGINKN